MDEEKWRRAGNPIPMLQHLCKQHQVHRRKSGRRKLQLLACAWCRRYWDCFPDWAQANISLLEAFHHGAASREAIDEAAAKVQTAHLEVVEAYAVLPNHPNKEKARSLQSTDYVTRILRRLLRFENLHVETKMIGGTVISLFEFNLQESTTLGLNERRNLIASEQEQMSHLVREIFGTPHSLPTVDPQWLSWNGNTVPKMAQQISTNGAFHQMPVLADALEEAGCADESILSHCRASTTHAKGCWVLDLLLNKGWAK